MPTDINYDRQNRQEFVDVLDELSRLVTVSNTNYITLGGDFNTDFTRNHSDHTRLLKEFMAQENLVNLLQHPNSDVTYTYESKANGERSTIDHFLVSENLYDNVSTYHSIHEGDNFSDHSPLLLNLSGIDVKQDGEEHVDGRSRVLWSKATEDENLNYKTCLDRLLQNINIPATVTRCNNVNCTIHRAEIDQLYEDIVAACLESSSECIPSSVFKEKVGTIPGWNEFVSRDRDTAMFWHRLWKSAGSPHNGYIADIRKTTRAKYHLAIRLAKKKKESTIANNMANSLLENRGRDFWTEIKKISSSKRSVPKNVDGHVGSKAIGDHFAEKYRTLFNSVPYCEVEMGNIHNDIELTIHNGCCRSNYCAMSYPVSVEDISAAIHMLKANKEDGYIGMSTNHLKYGPHRLRVMLSFLYSAIINHGYIPEKMLYSSIISIPKNCRKSASDSKNYRGTSLNGPFCKLLEQYILMKCEEQLTTTDLQFGFNPNYGKGRLDRPITGSRIVQADLVGPIEIPLI
jgi:hypothetical protein